MNVCISFEWGSPEPLTLDSAAKLRFPVLPAQAGIYRMTITAGPQTTVYVGETDNLKRRGGNYRNPGSRQRTSLRINGVLREFLNAGAEIVLATATVAHLTVDGRSIPIDLAKKPYRLLVESAALIDLADRGMETVLNL